MSGKRVREQSGRRTWNLEDYEIRQECIQETKRKQKSVDTEGFELAPLQARQEDLGLDKLVGKCEKVAHDAPKQKQGGFFCQVCDELFKDSQSYLDHVNGKKHIQKLGMDMKPLRSSVDAVKEKLAQLQKNKKKDSNSVLESSTQEDKKLEKKDRKPNQKQNGREEQGEEEAEEDPDLEMMKKMGFATRFVSKKR